MKQNFFLGLSEEGFHRVVYREWGASTDKNIPIICVHGLTRNASDFDYLAEFLSQHGEHLYCPDVVGRGDSDWLTNPLHYTYEQYIADMNTLIARTQAEQVNWIGTSMGGLLGMFLASMPKTPIKSLILNDIGPFIPATGLARLSKYVGIDPNFNSVEEAKNYFKSVYSDFGNLSDEEWQHFAENSIRQIDSGKYISKMDPAVRIAPAKSKIAWQVLLHPLKAMEGSLFDIDLQRIWKKVTCPVLVIRGKNSDLLLPNTVEKMRQTHGNVEMIEVPNAGHAPALIDAALHESIYAWLQRNK